MVSQQVCNVCHGTGKEIKEKCPTCRGTGHESRRHKVKVNVPAGVENGQQMRLQNQGEAGSNGGGYGDLYVIFRVAESNTFKRDGSEIFYELPLDFAQVALGDEVAVPTVHGDVKLKIPAGTQTGTNFRLRGKGAPKLRGSGNGDEHVVVKVITPKNLNHKQKEALREFVKSSRYKHPNENKNESFFDKFKKR
jgi:molecular chaperone DnaJ